MVDWFKENVARTQNLTDAPDRIKAILLRLRLGGSHSGDITKLAWNEHEKFLDAVDLGLFFLDGQYDSWSSLDAWLSLGGSVWTIGKDRRSLVRRVTSTEQAAFERATSPSDLASNELEVAWRKVYGRNPDPSDAWDHAIKACEHALKPIVTPTNNSATLGNVVGQLRAPVPVAELLLKDNGQRNVIGPLDAFEKILHLIWPNPDRHGGGADERIPTQQEAEAVVNLAVLVVQWARSGVLRKK